MGLGVKKIVLISKFSENLEFFPPTIEEQIVKSKFDTNELQKKSFTFLALVFFYELFRKYGENLNLEEQKFKEKIGAVIPEDGVRCYLTAGPGCGKSRVIKSFVEFIVSWGESEMVLVTATSGFAAMLLAHSKTSYTYHSALGFRRDGRARNPALCEIEKWGPRRFFIIDEISMAGCRDLDRISSRLQGLKANKKPFGGMHMVFTGDFNQNPPMGHPLYRNYSEYESKNPVPEAVLRGSKLW